MTILAEAQTIAALVETVTEFNIVYATPPPTVETLSAVVSPAPEWGSFDGSNYCEPLVSWEIIVIAPNTDMASSMVWLFDRVADLAAIDDLMVDSWTQPELIALNSTGGEGIAVRVQLHPRPIDLTGVT